jgi:biotin-dependent carboxylase-like uncharacterized protein
VTRLAVARPGLQTTVQDLGRVGFQALGVPVSGALDPVALRLANRLVGNDEGAAGLEIRLAGPSLEAVDGPVRLALAGTSTAFTVAAADGAVRTVEAWRAVDLAPGETAHFPALKDHATAIVAVAGGVDVAPVFGSRSTALRAGFGGLGGRALAAGDVLPLGRAAAGPCLGLADPPAGRFGGALRVVLGPQDDAFSEAGIAAFLAGPYRVGNDADRMGLRLEGPPIEHRTRADIPSDGIATGAIQVPGSGQPVLLLADHQTTGGYTKIAHVISADLVHAGRLMPGAEIRFRAVPVGEAEAARRALEREIAAAIARMAPVVGPGTVDLAALARANLISGVSAGGE